MRPNNNNFSTKLTSTTGINGKSLALLHHIDPTLNTENGQIGAILSSKALVQLVFNPLVTLVINRFGYELTLILGVFVLLQSCIRNNNNHYYYNITLKIFNRPTVYSIGQSFIMLLIPRALQGIGSALINVSGKFLMA